MKLPDLIMCFVVLAALGLGAARAAPDPVPSIDNGLGELPNFREWGRDPSLARIAVAAEASATRIPGEKLAGGLGGLPPYSEWRHHPELAHLVKQSERVSSLIERR